MILVLGQLAFLFAFWSLANRQVGSLLTLLTTLDDRRRCDEGSVAALAAGIARLETGTPPEIDRVATGPDTWDYAYPAASPAYRIRYIQTDDAGRAWDIRVGPPTAGDAPLPETFTP